MIDKFYTHPNSNSNQLDFNIDENNLSENIKNFYNNFYEAIISFENIKETDIEQKKKKNDEILFYEGYIAYNVSSLDELNKIISLLKRNCAQTDNLDYLIDALTSDYYWWKKHKIIGKEINEKDTKEHSDTAIRTRKELLNKYYSLVAFANQNSEVTIELLPYYESLIEEVKNADELFIVKRLADKDLVGSQYYDSIRESIIKGLSQKFNMDITYEKTETNDNSIKEYLIHVTPEKDELLKKYDELLTMNPINTDNLLELYKELETKLDELERVRQIRKPTGDELHQLNNIILELGCKIKELLQRIKLNKNNSI